jgi:two-component system OmpR family response regulator
MTRELNNILYVDDDKSITKMATVALGKIGKLDITVCHSGKEAIELFQKNDFDLVLLDVMMPEMDGKEAFNLLKKIKDQQKIIFLTGKDLPEELLELKNLGAMAVIKKPFNPMKLAEEVKSLWNSIE